MALSRKFLATLGIEADKIDEIITAHAESLEAVKADRDRYKAEIDEQKSATDAKTSELANVQKELDELKKQVEADTKEREGKDYDKLKEEFDKYKADQEAKEIHAAKEAVLIELLNDMRMSERGKKQVLKWMGADSVELDENKKIKNVSALKKQITEDWSHEIQTEGSKGAETPTPPGGSGGGTGKTKAEIMKIKDSKERQQAIIDNPSLFGLSAE